uniref:Uncharacterized protein n=1 Tax=viral metagenome TaxID=1070528 RepID=A0A6C0KD03_9ZZZZ
MSVISNEDLDALILKLSCLGNLNTHAVAECMKKHLPPKLKDKYLGSDDGDTYCNCNRAVPNKDTPSLIDWCRIKDIKRIYYWSHNDGVVRREVRSVGKCTRDEIHSELLRFDIEGPIDPNNEEKYNEQLKKDLVAECEDRDIVGLRRWKKSDFVSALVEDDQIPEYVEKTWSLNLATLQSECTKLKITVAGHQKRDFVHALLKAK